MKQPDTSEERHGEPPERESFAALFAMLDAPVDPAATRQGFERLLTRAGSTSFRRETLGKSY